jgi:hypothetical protein
MREDFDDFHPMFSDREAPLPVTCHVATTDELLAPTRVQAMAEHLLPAAAASPAQQRPGARDPEGSMC